MSTLLDQINNVLRENKKYQKKTSKRETKILLDFKTYLNLIHILSNKILIYIMLINVIKTSKIRYEC